MKRSKILCVGMTAALSFALIIAGCDGDGGSKNNGSTPTGGGKVSPVFQVEDGHNALKITGAAGASGFFKDGLHVYIKADGKEALITAAGTAPSGDYHAPSTTPVFIADTTGGAPALWVKNLDAAATPAANGKLLSGVNQITVNIAPDALENDVGDLGAVDSGTAVVVSANAGAAYKISASPPICEISPRGRPQMAVDRSRVSMLSRRILRQSPTRNGAIAPEGRGSALAIP